MFQDLQVVFRKTLNAILLIQGNPVNPVLFLVGSSKYTPSMSNFYEQLRKYNREGAVTMPTYDYLCETNGRMIEVSHKMSENIESWGQLCQQAGTEPGETPADTPVRRMITGGAIISSTSQGEPAPACGMNSCCPGGMCGLE